MREAYEQRADDLEAKYDKKMSTLRDDLELRRKTEVHEIEEVSKYIYIYINAYVYVQIHVHVFVVFTLITCIAEVIMVDLFF